MRPKTTWIALCLAVGPAVVSAFLADPAGADERGLLPQDFYQETTVTETAIAPDGGLVAFTVVTIDEEENARRREIWMPSSSMMISSAVRTAS